MRTRFANIFSAQRWKESSDVSEPGACYWSIAGARGSVRQGWRVSNSIPGAPSTLTVTLGGKWTRYWQIRIPSLLTKREALGGAPRLGLAHVCVLHLGSHAWRSCCRFLSPKLILSGSAGPMRPSSLLAPPSPIPHRGTSRQTLVRTVTHKRPVSSVRRLPR